MAITKAPPDRSKPTRVRKRNGPPSTSETVHVVESAQKQNFEFIIMTNPKQARDKENQKSIRSHVMFDYAQQKRRTQAIQPMQNQGLQCMDMGAGSNVACPKVAAGNAAADDGSDSSNPSPKRQDKSSRSQSQEKSTPLSRYYQALLKLTMTGSGTDQMRSVLDLDEKVFDLVWRKGLMESYMARGVGEGIDPFFVMPQFRNPNIYMAQIKMWCKSASKSEEHS